MGPPRRGSLCRSTERCTSDRSKLFGSHDRRPWLHEGSEAPSCLGATMRKFRSRGQVQGCRAAPEVCEGEPRGRTGDSPLWVRVKCELSHWLIPIIEFKLNTKSH